MRSTRCLAIKDIYVDKRARRGGSFIANVFSFYNYQVGKIGEEIGGRVRVTETKLKNCIKKQGKQR